jgi:predicted aldo/keto reductase-like oxidoreductase
MNDDYAELKKFKLPDFNDQKLLSSYIDELDKAEARIAITEMEIVTIERQIAELEKKLRNAESMKKIQEQHLERQKTYTLDILVKHGLDTDDGDKMRYYNLQIGRK